MNRAALVRDLRNAALLFQALTLAALLRHNPHSPEASLGEPVRAQPEPSNPKPQGNG